MKKILIISYNFAPIHTVGAIRPTKLAKYLTDLGNEVDVVASEPHGALDHSLDSSLNAVHRIDRIDCSIVDEKPVSAKSKAAPKTAAVGYKRMSLFRKFKRQFYEYKKIVNSKKFTRAFVKLIKNESERFASYDAVISTYGPLASHLCGLEFKKRFPHIKWIADFRDPMVLNTTPISVLRCRSSIQKRVCKEADKLVAVSNGYYERIFDEDAKKKALVVYNGFDRSDIDITSVERDGEFSFTYVGNMYEGQRDFSPLLLTLRSLIKEGLIKAEDVNIKYAGNTFAVLEKQAERVGFTGNLIDLGSITRSDCLKLQASSRHLLLSTWNEKGEHGVFPGKFLEYIMIGRPIISFVSGDEPGSEVTRVMKRAKLGITYEDATRETDLAALREYLIKDYEAFKNGKDAEFSPDPDEIARFDFANTAKSFEELL